MSRYHTSLRDYNEKLTFVDLECLQEKAIKEVPTYVIMSYTLLYDFAKMIDAPFNNYVSF